MTEEEKIKEAVAETVKETAKENVKTSVKKKAKKTVKKNTKKTVQKPAKEIITEIVKETPKETPKEIAKKIVTETVGQVKSGALNMNKKIIIGAVAVIAILVGVSRFTDNRFPVVSNKDQSLSSTNTASVASAPASGGNNSVTIGNQPAGNSVTISSVSVEKKGFAVIHAKDGDMLGKIIGSSELLAPGELSNLRITLREPTEAGKPYLVVLVVDNGDGRYMPGADRPVMNSADPNGGPLKTEFSVVTAP